MRKNLFISVLIPVVLLSACSSSRLIGKLAEKQILQTPSFQNAHTGISIYDPSSGQYLYEHQADRYFTPASNTKLFTLYAGLKYLGDSLPAIGYIETDTALFVVPLGDPTLLHPAFPRQPVIDFLKKARKNIYLVESSWREKALGAGWAWDDYNDSYMPERSPLPVYGNMIRWVQERQHDQKQDSSFGSSPSFYSVPEVDWPVRFTTDTARHTFFVKRQWDNNVFEISEGPERYKEQETPFITEGLGAARILLKDTVGRELFTRPAFPSPRRGRSPATGITAASHPAYTLLRSQPVDSLFQPMMYTSDNFFAEQTLLMVAGQRLGYMNDEAIIDTLLKTDFASLPQRPSWVDGSGLSRYNLFSPRDFVWLLSRMQQDFGMERIKRLLPTGGKGTLRNYYKQDSGCLFAKTGSLSGVVALSGYLLTKKGRLLIFSILVNNHQSDGATIRRSLEKMLHGIREAY